MTLLTIAIHNRLVSTPSTLCAPQDVKSPNGRSPFATMAA